jgi:hypothetical protein
MARNRQVRSLSVSQVCLEVCVTPYFARFGFLDILGALYFVALNPLRDFRDARWTFALVDCGVFVFAATGAIAMRPNPTISSGALSFIYPYSKPIVGKKTETFSQNNTR